MLTLCAAVITLDYIISSLCHVTADGTKCARPSSCGGCGLGMRLH